MWKDKVRIPTFKRIRLELQCFFKYRGRIPTFGRIKEKFQCCKDSAKTKF